MFINVMKYREVLKYFHMSGHRNVVVLGKITLKGTVREVEHVQLEEG